MKICIEAMNDIDKNDCIPKWLSALCIRLYILKQSFILSLHYVLIAIPILKLIAS